MQSKYVYVYVCGGWLWAVHQGFIWPMDEMLVP